MLDQPVRIAHATDIHWYVPPPLGRMVGNKRMLGGLNLWLRGRSKHFSPEVQDALVAHVQALAPDAFVITGDLTATALEDEFALAAERLAPVLEATPTLVMAGNHDVYTRGAQRAQRLAAFFAPHMGLGPTGDALLGRLEVGHVTVLALDPNRPGLLSSGMLPQEQLDALAAALASDALADRNVILALHYPILDRHGAVYDNLNHGLRNARALIAVLEAAPKRPIAILHGHEHHGFTVPLPLGDDAIPIFDPGSSGYAYMPERRRSACMNLYEITPRGALRVERYQYGADGFQPEPGGSYASGR